MLISQRQASLLREGRMMDNPVRRNEHRNASSPSSIRSSHSDPDDRKKRAVRAAKKKKKAKKSSRVSLSRAEAAAAGRKAAMIMHDEPASLTAHGKMMKKRQAYAIAASKISRGGH